ncbi:MAG TPA: lipocalin family protein [Ferruginibacter sp.]|nr:lipocalin family protein [Ferruginibacter sp.]
MKKIILSACIMAFAFVSCKKDSDPVCELNQANLVGSYKITALKYKADATTAEVDEFATWDACEKDDITVLNADNSVTFTDAGAVCTPNGSSTGIWAFASNVFTINGQSGTVSNFSCTGMTVILNGTTAGETTTITLVKQ